eukprot:GFUD01002678.1.p1 GENE.GFUD01002678.1~~GFUD01002678.1.p1  ORF type:complete len:455 (+),score=121.94 GFUD01002678.1:47-1366(+)
MKEDSTFKTLFQELQYNGSYYDKLAIADGYDFDLNMIFGISHSTFKIGDTFKDDPNFMKFVVSDRLDKKTKLITEVIGHEWLLSATKMREVMKASIDRAITNLGQQVVLANGSRIRVTRSEGLAVTLHLQQGVTNKVDVDLAPAIQFPINKLPKGLKSNLERIHKLMGIPLSLHEQCSLVALPMKHTDRLHVDFPLLAREMMSNRPSLRMTVRLLKQERNEKGGPFKQVKSFFIKMVALEAVLKNPSTDYWREEHLAIRYREMKNNLKQSLENNRLPDIFFPVMNLMERMSPQVKSDVAGYLEKADKKAMNVVKAKKKQPVVQNSKKVPCPLCGKTKFKSSTGAVQHIESGSCSQCKGRDVARENIYQFVSKQATHLLTARPQLTYSGSGASCLTVPEKPYACSHCEKTFVNVSSLMQHQADKHGLSGGNMVQSLQFRN